MHCNSNFFNINKCIFIKVLLHTMFQFFCTLTYISWMMIRIISLLTVLAVYAQLFVYSFKGKIGKSPRSNSHLWSQLADKFSKMVERFSKYSNDEIRLLENDRLKHLVYGGREALNDTNVLQSFSILYEDILPVRFGGDILFNMIEKALQNAKKSKKSDSSLSRAIKEDNPTSILKEQPTNMQKRVISQIMSYALPEDLQRCDSLFSEIDSDSNGSISFEEFQAWVASIDIADNTDGSILQAENDSNTLTSSAENLFSVVDVNNDGTISYEEFKMWTTGLHSGEECDVLSTLSIHDIPSSSPGTRKYRERYLHMIQCFSRWGENITTQNKFDSNPRMNLVIQGCFEGAKNPGVVKALGILYEDYLPLRIAGDAIFKLMESKLS